MTEIAKKVVDTVCVLLKKGENIHFDIALSI